MADDSALTRFANSEIHQNVAETNVTINLRVVDRQADRRRVVRPDRRRGPAPARRERGRDRPRRRGARRLGRPARPDRDPRRRRRPTARRPPARPRSSGPRRVRAVIGAADDAGVTAYGSFATEHRIDRGRQLGTAPGPPGRGRPRSSSPSRWARAAAAAMPRRPRSTPRRSTPRRSAARPPSKARATANAVSIEPGDYPVVLEEYAVVDLLDMLGYLGFSALAVQEERSFVEPGKRIGSDLVTIVDDGYDPAGLPLCVRLRGRRQAAGPARRGRRLPRRRLRRPDRGTRRRARRPATACRPRTRGGRSR